MLNKQTETPVVIVDFDVPFVNLVKFLIKLSLAAIPALLVLSAFNLLVRLLIHAVIDIIRMNQF